MANDKVVDAYRQFKSNDDSDDDSSHEKEKEVNSDVEQDNKDSNDDDKKPQSKPQSTDQTNGNSTKPPYFQPPRGVTTTPSHDDKKKSEDDDISALAEGLGGVSIESKPSLLELTAPESIKNIAALISSNKYKNIIVLTGAGVSCNAGIPDFRSPGTGLYDNLAKYNLPYPEAVFDIGFYKRNPAPFVQLASELWPGLKHSPTITHTFIALLEKKGLLLRTYTQNIDMLDVLAGVSEEKMIECHGHFRTAACTICKRSFDGDECKRIITIEKQAPKCAFCKGYVKPDIVFFGESLPNRYHRLVKRDCREADLILVMGTCKWNLLYYDSWDVRTQIYPSHTFSSFNISKPSWSVP